MMVYYIFIIGIISNEVGLADLIGLLILMLFFKLDLVLNILNMDCGLAVFAKCLSLTEDIIPRLFGLIE